jgi:hypothetical protein
MHVISRLLVFFFGGRLRVPTRRCNLVVPADGGWGRSNKTETNKNKDLTNTITMVVEPPTPQAAWI